MQRLIDASSQSYKPREREWEVYCRIVISGFGVMSKDFAAMNLAHRRVVICRMSCVGRHHDLSPFVVDTRNYLLVMKRMNLR